MPIVDSIKEAGWHSEVVFFRPEWSERIFEYVSENFDAYISREPIEESFMEEIVEAFENLAA